MRKLRGYTDKELLDRASRIRGFSGFPDDYWILGVQNSGHGFNVFDDKVYIYKGKQFIMVLPATTNAGSVLKQISPYNKKGTAIIKTNEWYHNLWRNGLHKGRMKALVQISNILYYRDNDKNGIPDEKGTLYKGLIGINYHTVSYTKKTNFIAKYIGNWSVGCVVIPDVDKYYKSLELFKNQKYVSYCYLKEF